MIHAKRDVLNRNYLASIQIEDIGFVRGKQAHLIGGLIEGGKKQFGLGKVNVARDLNRLAAEVYEDEAALPLIFALKGDQIAPDFHRKERAFLENGVFFAQLRKLFVEIKQRGRVGKLVFDVDGRIIGVDREPGFRVGREASGNPIVPLDRGPGVVAVDVMAPPLPQGFGDKEAAHYLIDGPAAHVEAFRWVDGREVAHPDFLTLVDEGGAPKGEEEGGEGLARIEVIRIAVTRYGAELIMVF